MFDPRRHLDPLVLVDHWWDPLVGHVVWRAGTGGNVEVVHLRAYVRRVGNGRRLVREMLLSLRNASAVPEPYATVYGFSLPDNRDAHAFYRAVGFTTSEVAGVYAAGAAVVFSARYDELLRRNLGVTR